MPFEFSGSIWDWFGRPKKINWTVTLDSGPKDTVIRNGDIMEINIARLLKPGFRRQIRINSDEPLDKGEDGHYLQFEQVEGNAKLPTIKEESEESSIIWIYGTGNIGQNVVLITADGHVGAGKATIQLKLIYQVGHPDATELTGEEVPVPDEAIEPETPPAEQPPAV